MNLTEVITRALALLMALMLVGPVQGWVQAPGDTLPGVIQRWLAVQTGSFDLERCRQLFTEDVRIASFATYMFRRGIEPQRAGRRSSRGLPGER